MSVLILFPILCYIYIIYRCTSLGTANQLCSSGYYRACSNAKKAAVQCLTFYKS